MVKCVYLDTVKVGKILGLEDKFSLLKLCGFAFLTDQSETHVSFNGFPVAIASFGTSDLENISSEYVTSNAKVAAKANLKFALDTAIKWYESNNPSLTLKALPGFSIMKNKLTGPLTKTELKTLPPKKWNDATRLYEPVRFQEFPLARRYVAALSENLVVSVRVNPTKLLFTVGARYSTSHVGLKEIGFIQTMSPNVFYLNLHIDGYKEGRPALAAVIGSIESQEWLTPFPQFDMFAYTNQAAGME